MGSRLPLKVTGRAQVQAHIRGKKDQVTVKAPDADSRGNVDIENASEPD